MNAAWVEPVGPFQLLAERDDADLSLVQFGLFETAEDAVREAERLDESGSWPEAHEAILLDLGAGTKWLWTGEGSMAVLE